MQRRHLIATTLAATLPTLGWGQALEKPQLTIAVGGKNLFYYLPLTIAEQLGYFKAEGLDVTIVDFSGGARALQAVVGGSADVVSGAFEHTVNMHYKGQPMRAFVVQGAAPQITLGYNPKAIPNYQSVADLRGKKIGVTAPGSSTNVVVNFVLAKAGLKPSDVSIVGVGAGNGAVAAMRSGQVDAMSNLDPVSTLLTRSGDMKIITDTRNLAEAEKITPGFNSPTVMALEDASWCAVRAMVKRGEVHGVMEKLEAIGASAIIETRIGNCRL
jgi:NitT/TauT family transport system substrate-binding protein